MVCDATPHLEAGGCHILVMHHVPRPLQPEAGVTRRHPILQGIVSEFIISDGIYGNMNTLDRVSEQSHSCHQEQL